MLVKIFMDNALEEYKIMSEKIFERNSTNNKIDLEGSKKNQDRVSEKTKLNNCLFFLFVLCKISN